MLPPFVIYAKSLKYITLFCRERCPQRSVGFNLFSRTAARAVPTIIIELIICSGRCPHRPKAKCLLFACGESVRRDAEPYGLFVFLFVYGYNILPVCLSILRHGFRRATSFAKGGQRSSNLLHGLLRKGAARRAED